MVKNYTQLTLALLISGSSINTTFGMLTKIRPALGRHALQYNHPINRTCKIIEKRSIGAAVALPTLSVCAGTFFYCNKSNELDSLFELILAPWIGFAGALTIPVCFATWSLARGTRSITNKTATRYVLNTLAEENHINSKRATFFDLPSSPSRLQNAYNQHGFGTFGMRSKKQKALCSIHNYIKRSVIDHREAINKEDVYALLSATYNKNEMKEEDTALKQFTSNIRNNETKNCIPKDPY